MGDRDEDRSEVMGVGVGVKVRKGGVDDGVLVRPSMGVYDVDATDAGAAVVVEVRGRMADLRMGRNGDRRGIVYLKRKPPFWGENREMVKVIKMMMTRRKQVEYKNRWRRFVKIL